MMESPGLSHLAILPVAAYGLEALSGLSRHLCPPAIGNANSVGSTSMLGIRGYNLILLFTTVLKKSGVE